MSVEIQFRRWDAIAVDVETGIRIGTYDFTSGRNAGTIGPTLYRVPFSEWCDLVEELSDRLNLAGA